MAEIISALEGEYMMNKNNKPVFDTHSVESWGYDERGNQLLLTESKYIWIIDSEGQVFYDGELLIN